MPTTFQPVIDLLSTCRRVLVTTHARPDGDALGSTAAIVLALRALKIESDVLLFSHLPRKYSFLFTENKIAHIDVEAAWPATFDIKRYDAFVIVDTGTWSQLPGLQERWSGWHIPTIILDHHLTQETWGDIRLVQSEAAAAGEIVADLVRAWRIPLDYDLASVLYVAIASDTGWFQFSNTRPYTLRLAADLMERDVDTDRIYQALYQNEKPQRVRLLTRALDSMELLAGERLSVMTLRKQDFVDTGASVADTENLINVPLQVASVEVSMLITEPPEGGPTRVSLRSKGQVNVARFAEKFAGGGHARASGLKLDLPVDQTHEEVVTAMLAEMGDGDASR